MNHTNRFVPPAPRQQNAPRHVGRDAGAGAKGEYTIHPGGGSASGGVNRLSGGGRTELVPHLSQGRTNAAGIAHGIPHGLNPQTAYNTPKRAIAGSSTPTHAVTPANRRQSVVNAKLVARGVPLAHINTGSRQGAGSQRGTLKPLAGTTNAFYLGRLQGTVISKKHLTASQRAKVFWNKYFLGR